MQRIRSARVLSLALVCALGVTGHAVASQKAGAGDSRSSRAFNPAAARSVPSAPLSFSNRVINNTSVNDSSADTTAQDTQSETTATADGNKVVVAFNDSGSFNGTNNHFTGWSSSSNSGAAFTDHGALPASANGDAGDPSLAANTTTGDIFMATLGFNSGNSIQLFKSTDGGVSFGAPVNAVPSGGDLDKEWLAVDNFPGARNGDLYLCATDFGFSPARIVVTHSTNNGATWGPAGGVVLSSTGQSQGCYVAVGPDHSVYVAYFRGNSPNALFVRRSTDGAVTFGAEHQVTTLNTTSVNGGLNLNGGLRSNSFPHMAVNPVSGDLIVVWNDDPAPAGGADRGDVFYSRSLNNGTTWSAPVKINDDGGRDQFTPTVAISPSGGEVMFGYYSRSHDSANLMFHRRIRPALMDVATGAITKRHSAQLSPDTPVVIGQDPVINPTYMGDYDVIAANDSTFFSSWADNRASSSAHTFQPDVYLARVARTAPSTNTNVGVTVTPNPSTVDEGDTTTLAVKATAVGHSARDVYISLAPANGLNYSSTSGGGGCKIVNGFVGCNLGTIGAGATVQRNVIATATSAGSRTATAKVTTTDNDTNQGNNTGSGTVTVNPVAKVTETYSTGNIAVAIPDTSTVNVPLAIGPNSTLFDVNASVRLNHTFDSDLAISLVSPGGGTVIDLSSSNGGSGDNYGTGANSCAGTPTVFDQQAATAITSAAAPFAGSFMPEQSLAGANGLPSGGTWNLRVADQAPADVGTIGCFELKIRRAAP